jgi:N utilization substance protein B
MGKRRKAREFALQILFQLNLRQEKLKDEMLEGFWDANPTSQDVKEYTTILVRGTIENLREIDKIVTNFAENWTIERMASVDRNILRFATYELLHRYDIPSTVIINEAIEIAKRYGTEESGSFINGILDRIAKEVRKNT